MGRSVVEEEEDQDGSPTDRKIDVEAALDERERCTHKGRHVTTYHHRQLTRCVRTPPRRGPATLATLKIAPTRPVRVGILDGSMLNAMRI